MFTVVGVYDVKGGVFVHCVSDVDKNGHSRCEKVYVKEDSDMISRCFVGARCTVNYVKYNDKYYTFINI